MELRFDAPSERQKDFLLGRHRFVAFGGARGGGKSWAVRTKAKLLCLKFAGIKVCIIRKTYPELKANHIDALTAELKDAAKYRAADREFLFFNSSRLALRSCRADSELTKFQGTEYDVVFIDEATQFSEEAFRVISATVRGVNSFPKRVYLTCNPGGVGHSWVKRLFIDRRYKRGERAEDYSFIKSLVSDNPALAARDPLYRERLEALPEKLRRAWLDGDWDIFEGQFFEEFRDVPEHYADRRFTHVIDPFEVPSDWTLWRSYDFGYGKPFDVSWWAIVYEG
ncbi:MAG: phage terminase large subunit [Clostridia bacterium]|nr:phage terminase large subunit [Clostridia bacterium]